MNLLLVLNNKDVDKNFSSFGWMFFCCFILELFRIKFWNVWREIIFFDEFVLSVE